MQSIVWNRHIVSHGIRASHGMESMQSIVWNHTLCRELSLGHELAFAMNCAIAHELASVLVKATHGACETGREGTNAQSSAYFVRQYKWSRLKTDKKRRELAFCKVSTLFLSVKSSNISLIFILGVCFVLCLLQPPLQRKE